MIYIFEKRFFWECNLGYTLKDWRRTSELREECKIKDVARWTHAQIHSWIEHVSKMRKGRQLKITRDEKPASRRHVKEQAFRLKKTRRRRFFWDVIFYGVLKQNLLSLVWFGISRKRRWIILLEVFWYNQEGFLIFLLKYF